MIESRDFTEASENFPDRILNLSTENIPIEVQKNFPKTENVKFNLITPGYINETTSIYYFSFGEFKVSKRKVFVWFNENDYGGGGSGFEYVFQKIKGKWKMIKPEIIRFNIRNT